VWLRPAEDRTHQSARCQNEFAIDGLAKVTGQRCGHFAAFFKKSWRANDIMWGRLDASYELVDMLVDAKRVRAVFDKELTADSGVLIELGNATKLLRQTLEPKLDPLTHAKLFTWLEELGSSDRTVRQQALAQLGQTRDNPKEWLRFAAQREVLGEGLRDVFQDAAHEQLSWNH
jgi:hypothetical protein